MKPWQMPKRTSVHVECCHFDTTFRLQDDKTSFININTALLISFCYDINRNSVCDTLSKALDLSKKDTIHLINLIHKHLLKIYVLVQKVELLPKEMIYMFVT